MTVTAEPAAPPLLRAALRPVSAASLAFFRIAFGLAMIVNTWLYIPILVGEYYVEPGVHFPYPPLTFIAPLPGIGMHVLYVVMSLTGLLIALGFWYRASVAAFFVLHTYVFLIDSTYFQNHEYLISLLAFLMFFLPAHRMWSLDARRRPAVAGATVPAWTIWLLRFQIGVPYFFGAIAKLNADWMAGEPLRMWLERRTDVEIVGPLFTNEAVVLFMNYGSLVFDLVVVGFLLHPRTRLAAFLVACCFHLINVRLFGLFIFPWLMILATTIFFRPDWPLCVRAWWLNRRRTSADARTVPADTRAAPAGTRAAPAGTRAAPTDRPVHAEPSTDATSDRPEPMGPDQQTTWTTGRRLVAVAVAGWVLVQVLLPLRHYAIPGNPSWTEEAHRFAWHMKLRDKQGSATFHVTTDNGRTFAVDPDDHLTSTQVYLLTGHPSRIVQFAHYLSERHGGAEVRAETSVSLNGREPVPLVDPTADLAAVPLWWWGHADWILPLDEPLRRE
jgi:vitamin K-dependent gamma-carboxylase